MLQAVHKIRRKAGVTCNMNDVHQSGLPGRPAPPYQYHPPSTNIWARAGVKMKLSRLGAWKDYNDTTTFQSSYRYRFPTLSCYDVAESNTTDSMSLLQNEE